MHPKRVCLLKTLKLLRELRCYLFEERKASFVADIEAHMVISTRGFERGDPKRCADCDHLVGEFGGQSVLPPNP